MTRKKKTHFTKTFTRITLNNNITQMNKSIEYLRNNKDIIKASFVANRTGLSPTLISNLINGKVTKISHENALKIETVVKQLKAQLRKAL